MSKESSIFSKKKTSGKRKNFLFFFCSVTLLIIALALVNDVYKRIILVQGNEKELFSESLRYLSFQHTVRAYPSDQIPEMSLKRAFEEFSRTKKKLKKFTNSWESIGPNNVAGRMLAIEFNPNNPQIVWAGSASGGLWKSETGGTGLNAWSRIELGYPVVSVSSIAISATNPDILYIGTGEVYGELAQPSLTERTIRGMYGIGILKSEDGGVSWRQSLNWLGEQGKGVQRIKLNPHNENSIYAATTDGIYKSLDAGASWTLINDIIMATDIEIDPTDTTIIYSSHGGMGSPGHGIYKSSDAGKSWNKLNTGDSAPSNFGGKAMLGISKSAPNILYASIGFDNGTLPIEERATYLIRSDDSGFSWSLISDEDYASSQGWYSHDLEVHPDDPDNVWVVGANNSPYFTIRNTISGELELKRAISEGLFQSKFENATEVYPELNTWVDFHQIIFHPSDPDIIYFANDGGIFRTTDGGKTSENLNHGLQTTQFYPGFSNSNTNDNFALGGLQDNYTLRYNGNKSWQRVFFGDGGWSAIDQSNNDVAYVSAQELVIFKFFDGGSQDLTNASNVSPPVEEQDSELGINFISPFALSSVDNQTLYSAASNVWVSSDGGINWSTGNKGESLDSSPALAIGLSSQSTNVAYVSTIANDISRSNIFKTLDKGDSWVNITLGLPDLIITDIAVHPQNDEIVSVSLGGFYGQHIFKTEDGGENWEDITYDLPDVPAWSVLFNPLDPEIIYAGNDFGVFYLNQNFSEDGWQSLTSSLGDAVIAMDLSTSLSSGKLRVATHGNGVFQTDLISSDTLRTIPEDFKIYQNYPNPFNPITRISFDIAKIGEYKLEVYTINGKKVATLIDSKLVQGRYEIEFSGEGLSSGTYILKLSSSFGSVTRKMTLIK